MSHIVLFQREISPTSDYVPARSATILKPTTKASDMEVEAVRATRVGYRAYLVKFDNLPPDNILINACEEAVRNKKAFALPLKQVSPELKRKFN